jgi:hypothetical protein
MLSYPLNWKFSEDRGHTFSTLLFPTLPMTIAFIDSLESLARFLKKKKNQKRTILNLGFERKSNSFSLIRKSFNWFVDMK